MNKELVVITGCDSGIGMACAGILIKQGREVVLSYVESNPFKNEPLCHAYRMDLGNEKDIDKFAESIKRLCKKGYSLSCLFSNSGIALGGPVENTPLAVFRSVFEVNYFGHVSVIQKLIPLIKESRGMIMIHGSLAGKVALPFLAPYASSKHALEGLADSLRRELKPFGVRTVLIESAAIATPIWIKGKNSDRSYIDDVYMESIKLFDKNFIDAGGRGMPAGRAAAEIVKIMDKKNPRPRYIVSGTKAGSYIESKLPAALMDRILAKVFGMNYR